MHIKVTLDITKPLLRKKKITIESLDPMCISFTYKDLPKFCYWCRVIGRNHKDYTRWLGHSKSRVNDEVLLSYGNWLRAGRKQSNWVPKATNMSAPWPSSKLQGDSPPQQETSSLGSEPHPNPMVCLPGDNNYGTKMAIQMLLHNLSPDVGVAWKKDMGNLQKQKVGQTEARNGKAEDGSQQRISDPIFPMSPQKESGPLGQLFEDLVQSPS